MAMSCKYNKCEINARCVVFSVRFFFFFMFWISGSVSRMQHCSDAIVIVCVPGRSGMHDRLGQVSKKGHAHHLMLLTKILSAVRCASRTCICIHTHACIISVCAPNICNPIVYCWDSSLLLSSEICRTI